MMTKDVALARIEQVGIIPSVRVRSADDALFAAETVGGAGIPIVEVTMTTPDALAVIARLARAMPDVVVGAGTVCDVEMARRCLDAGAGFITSPGLDVPTVAFAVQAGALVFPGVMTPTDIMAAAHAGAELVKVFPCAPLGGPPYLRMLSAPFPQIGFIASGGVDQQTAGAFIQAGAIAVGVGAELIPRRAIHARDARWIVELARRFMAIVQEARTRSS